MRRIHRQSLSAALAIATLWFASPSIGRDDLSPRLDPPGSRSGEPSPHATYRAAGRDPDAPRALVLWRWHDDRFIRLASGRSRIDGRFDFGEQPLPSPRVYFHVSVADTAPDAEFLMVVERRVPAPLVLADAPDSTRIFLVAAEPGGEFRFHDADSGRLLLRKPVVGRDGDPVSLDLSDELSGAWPNALRIEQVLDDGRRSDTQYWRLD
jgi:hypothetical protein